MRPRARWMNKRALIVEHSDITLPAEALHRVTHSSDFLSVIGASALVACFETDLANRSSGRLKPER
jgi:hypothetical protein